LKSGKRVSIAAGFAVCGALLLRAQLAPWIGHTPVGPALTALVRSVAMPGGSVTVERPPAEARPALTSLISAAPHDATLYRLRAQEDELALDFAAAEADWKAYAANASDRYAAEIDLADFYHRRIRPRDEIGALLAATAVKDDLLLPALQQPAWHAFERMATVAQQEEVPDSTADTIYRDWVARYPKEPSAWQKRIAFATEQREFTVAEAAIANYAHEFHDDLEPVSMRARVELRRGSPDAALAIYDRAFEPLWPQSLWGAWFSLLEQQGRLREFAGRVRTALASNPTDLDATARLFDYFRSQNNLAAARRVLLECRIAKESRRQPWTASELRTMAQLFAWVPDVNESARMDYALYSAPGGGDAEEALNGLATLLLTAPDQPIQFGSGDLSLYKDIATLDASPGFLNGILSLVLNGAGPRWEYRTEDQKSTAYFHRAAGTRLVSLLDQRFPRSAYRAPLHAALVTAYALYGDDAGVIRAGRDYLAAFADGSARVSVAMQVADALARAGRTPDEFALYDQLLRELATKASRVPIGANQTGAARSPEYVQVLNRYLSRLAALHRPLDALRVYRDEIDRNPGDPGLYAGLADFLEQNGMARDVEDVYTQAIARFADRSWYDKLARWYLRRQEYTALEKISRDAIAAFSGSELEQYFAGIVTQTEPDAALYRQLNLYAHERFPEDLVFVRNLIAAYSRRETYDAAAAESLLRQYWFYDPRLRTELFQRLSQSGRLRTELAAIRAANPAIAAGQPNQALQSNPAAVQFAAEAEIWQSHFEEAAAPARALANAYSGSSAFAGRASSLYRSLAAYFPRDTEIALTLAGYEQRADPRNADLLARMGDILADRGLMTRARALWERMPTVQPRNPAGYLDAATVFWDYYRYTDALRTIALARARFKNPALFAYEAGAIGENRRDYPSAVREYVAGALAGAENAQNRLLRLAQRAETRGAIDRATAAAVAGNPTPQAISLRVSVLEAENRRADLEALLAARVASETSSTELASLQETARSQGFDAIEEHAGERLAAITSDPVDKMRLTLNYARLLESKKDIAAAGSAVDGLYRGHPLILGVIRADVDFHVRNHQPAAAIDVLLASAKSARADLAAQFTLESACIATTAGQFDRARTLLNGLLAADALNADYLSAMADTYLEAKDDRGFRDYELATIDRLKQSSLAPADRAARIAGIRRSLIPALDRSQDSSGAVDQYIAIINAYPEDAALAKEAAEYAVAHAQAPRLIAFYRKTVSDAPRDYRWPIVLGRIETVAEDYPAAIADYALAIKDRPDRADVLQAQANLEERLMRFHDAMGSYSRLYDLTYRDPQWMVKVAEMHARSGQPAEAVKSLQSAIIGARTETADADLEIARCLADWHILPDAVQYLDRAASLAGTSLFQNYFDLRLYAQVMATAQRMDTVLAKLGQNPGVDQQVAEIAGEVVKKMYTPEEKSSLEQLLLSRAAGLPRRTRDARLLPIAQAAGLADLEARWRLDSMTAAALQVDARFTVLQSQRGVFAELGREMEQYAAQNAGRQVEAQALAQAAEAYIAAGDTESQMRVMRQALARNALSGALLERYLAMLALRDPQALTAVARNGASSDIRNAAVQAAIANGSRDLAYAAIQARGAALPAVWTKAYTALAGNYLADRSAAIDAAFQSALDTRAIGQRLAAPPNPSATIVGSVWFYYGARYGEYLADGRNSAAEAWLPASLEAAPLNAGAHLALGDWYAQAGQAAKAAAQYDLALELDNDRGDAHDHIARVLWSEGRHAEAVAQWKAAISTFLSIQSRGIRVPESFWSRAAATFTDIGEHHAMADLRGDISHLLVDYYQRNGEYRFEELIQTAARASLASGDGLQWLVALARTLPDAQSILFTLQRAPGLTDAQRTELLQARVDVLAQQAAGEFGDARQSGESEAITQRIELIVMLLNAGDWNAADAQWALVPPLTGPRPRWGNYDGRDAIEIRLASHAGRLPALLARYRAQQESAPTLESLRNAALALRNAGDEEGALTVLEFLYDRELRAGHLDASNFLGLAEVKLERKDSAAALALLNRMVLVAEDGFETLLPAARLLEKYSQAAPAADFARRRLQAAPWDSAARVQLARLLPTASPERQTLLATAITDSHAEYQLRAEAARLIAPHDVPGIAGTELALLASSTVTPQTAEKPFSVETRADAAARANAPSAQLALWQGAMAIAPADPRVRLGALRAALALQRDNLALAIEQAGQAFPPPKLSDSERAALEEALSRAAERVQDLSSAERYLRTAISLTPAASRAALNTRLNGLVAEATRRASNAARQPLVKDVIEQDRTVRPRISGGAQ